MNPPELFVEVRDKRTAFLPGETVEFSALWALPSAPASLEARLVWFTRGRGSDDAEIVRSQRVPSPAAAGHQVFTFKLPEAPYSFSGKLISLIWALELVAEPGAKNARAEFVMSPTRNEITLVSLPDAPRPRQSIFN